MYSNISSYMCEYNDGLVHISNETTFFQNALFNWNEYTIKFSFYFIIKSKLDI